MPVTINPVTAKPFCEPFNDLRLNINNAPQKRKINIPMTIVTSLTKISKKLIPDAIITPHLPNTSFLTSSLNKVYQKNVKKPSSAQKPSEHFRPGGFGINRKSDQTSQSLLPVPCKCSSDVPISSGFRLSVARPHRCASPVPAQPAPCGFVPLR